MSIKSGALYATCFLFGLAVSGLYLALAFNYSTDFVREAFLYISGLGSFLCLALARRRPRVTGTGYGFFVLGCALVLICLRKMLPPLTEVLVDIAPHLILIAVGLGAGIGFSRIAKHHR